VEAREREQKENRHAYILKIGFIGVSGNILTYYMRIWSAKYSDTDRAQKNMLQEWGGNDCSRNF
jgi:hypothetical protein